MCTRHAVQCIIPPYITEHLARSTDPIIRARAVANLQEAATMRTLRVVSRAAPSLMVSPAPMRKKHRLVYDAKFGDRLMGRLVRSEGTAKASDKTVNEAYDGAGDTYDFFERVFARNSLDGKGMALASTVHIGDVDDTGRRMVMNNAFWDGEQMSYGDGDGIIFRRFTASLDVIAHELTHAVEAFTSNLEYVDQPGALNEHFADVFGVLVRQWKNGEAAACKANWIIGAELLEPADTRRGIRDMEHPGTAFVDDPLLGSDPQPCHYSALYKGTFDRRGVHINCGIPNRAFVLAAKALEGKAWEVAGRIWYDTLLQLTSTSTFIDCARLSVQIAGSRKYGPAAKKAVASAWRKVGLPV